jgi:hypothetical protein
MREKISSSQIDKNDTLFLLPGDKAIQDADQNIVRTIDGKVLDKFKEAYGYSSIYGNQDTDVIYIPPDDPGVGGEIAALLPQLGDISIKSQTVNYNTNPPTVTVVLKIKNSTGKTIIGMKGKKPA